MHTDMGVEKLMEIAPELNTSNFSSTLSEFLSKCRRRLNCLGLPNLSQTNIHSKCYCYFSICLATLGLVMSKFCCVFRVVGAIRCRQVCMKSSRGGNFSRLAMLFIFSHETFTNKSYIFQHWMIKCEPWTLTIRSEKVQLIFVKFRRGVEAWLFWWFSVKAIQSAAFDIGSKFKNLWKLQQHRRWPISVKHPGLAIFW